VEATFILFNLCVFLLGMSPAATTEPQVPDAQRLRARVAIGPSDRQTASHWAAFNQLDSLLPRYLAPKRFQYVPHGDVKTVTEGDGGSPDAWTLPDLAALGHLLQLTFMVELRAAYTPAGSTVCARILQVEARTVVDSVCVNNTDLTERAVRQLAPQLGRKLNRLFRTSSKSARPHLTDVDADDGVRNAGTGRPSSFRWSVGWAPGARIDGNPSQHNAVC
jgi:hypothetical protein